MRTILLATPAPALADALRSLGEQVVAEPPADGFDALVMVADPTADERFAGSAPAALRALLEERLLAPLRRTDAFVRLLRARGRGLVVHVLPDPWEVRNAGLAGVAGGLAAFTEALRKELAEHGIRVVTIVARDESPATLASAIAGELGREPA